MQIVFSIVVALMVSMLTYLTKLQKGDKFDPSKLIRTLVVGAVIGGVAVAKKFEITVDNWEGLVAANAGIVAMADQVLKMLIRWIGSFKKTPTP